MTTIGRQGSNGRGPSRRQVMKGAAAGAAALTLPRFAVAQSAKFLKPVVAALNGREGDPTHMSIALISKIMKEKYDVAIDLQVHHSSALGSDVSQLEAVMTGFIDISSNSTSNFAPYTKAWAFMDLPYVFSGWDMVEKFYRSDLFRQQAEQMEKEAPVKVLPPLGAGGFRVLWNTKRELSSPDDAKGLKFQTDQSPINNAVVKAWGGNPTPMPFTELYTSLQQGVVDGMHLQPIWAANFNFFEQVKHGTEVQSTFVTQCQVLNINTWKAMPKKVQEAFYKAAEEAAELGHQKDRERFDASVKRMAEKGVKIHTPTAAELAKWRERGTSIWGDFKVDPAILQAVEKLRG